MLKICGHRVLLKPVSLEEVDETYKRAKAAGIELFKSDEDKRREQNAVDKGIVVSVGNTAWKDLGGGEWAKVGDTIVYPKYSGKWIEDTDKEKYLVLNDEDVLAVITEGN